MRLAMILLRQGRDKMLNEKLPRGNIYRGKYRLVKKVDFKGLQELHRRYAREERNMLLLRHPYLTIEQSHGHSKALGKVVALREKWDEVKLANFPKHVTLEDRLMHLQVKDAWD